MNNVNRRQHSDVDGCWTAEVRWCFDILLSDTHGCILFKWRHKRQTTGNNGQQRRKRTAGTSTNMVLKWDMTYDVYQDYWLFIQFVSFCYTCESGRFYSKYTPVFPYRYILCLSTDEAFVCLFVCSCFLLDAMKHRIQICVKDEATVTKTPPLSGRKHSLLISETPSDSTSYLDISPGHGEQIIGFRHFDKRGETDPQLQV